MRLAAHVGVPEVYVQRMVYYLDGDEPPGMMTNGHALFDDFDERADRAIAEAEAVGRELGIPTVVGVTGAMRLIADGEPLELDGTAGTVRRLDAP